MKGSVQSPRTSRAVVASFDRAARTYLAHAHVQKAMADWLAEWIPTDRSGRALEVGAGPGLFTRLLLPWAGRFTASDISAAMCATGRAVVPQADWQVMAAESPRGGPWDWIFSSSMLQWAEDPAAVFAAWRGSLAPGGRLLAGLFAADSLPEWTAVADKSAPLVWRSPEAWRDALRRAGFKLLRDGSEERTFVHPTARAFLRSLHGVGAAPDRRYPPGELRALLRDYEARYRRADGVPATWTFYRFEASASSRIV